MFVLLIFLLLYQFIDRLLPAALTGRTNNVTATPIHPTPPTHSILCLCDIEVILMQSDLRHIEKERNALFLSSQFLCDQVIFYC